MLDPIISKYMSNLSKKGHSKLTKAQRVARAKKAIVARWEKYKLKEIDYTGNNGIIKNGKKIIWQDQ